MTELSKTIPQHYALGKPPHVATTDIPTLMRLVITEGKEGDACHTLGMAHFYKLAGLHENRSTALEWFKKGIEKGHTPSAVCAGWLILDNELKKNFPDADTLVSAISFLEQGKDEGIFTIGHPNAVNISDLVERGHKAIARARSRPAEQPRPTATILDISRRSQRNA